ncbi:MAG: PIG-L family deacetylase [Actinomycetota bacterium]|nr:PIG-L family deacetylase [Actinomycetota bacterium]
MADLAPLPEDWDRALAIVAHPDDLEYGASAAVARWTDAGKTVSYLLASRGEAGIGSMPPVKAGPLRSAEQVAAAAIVGVDVVEFLDHPDGVIEYGVALRRDLASAIRRHRPELVITLNHRETFEGGHLNMADHRNVGIAVLDAVRDAANRWVFPDLGAAWDGVRWVAVASSPAPTHAVDIVSTVDRGVASLRAHAAYLAALDGPMADAGVYLRTLARDTGERFGGRSAVSFELIAM